MHAHTQTPRVHSLLLIYQPTNTRRARVSTILARLSITRPHTELEAILTASGLGEDSVQYSEPKPGENPEV